MGLALKITGVDSDTQPVLSEVLKMLGHTQSEDGILVTVKQCGDGISIVKNQSEIQICYGKKNELFRAFSLISDAKDGNPKYTEKAKYKELCVMADMSRNGVMNISSVKRYLRYLAIMGFNSMMLYTEDTYEVPEYPYFGHLRGRYTQAELKELDDYAYSLGIELIPCIQTLAHFTAVTRWNFFNEINDVNDILLTEDQRSYDFIDAMLRSVVTCFRSRKINLGMDEAHMLGLGKYLDKHGYHPRSEIMLKHLSEVVKLCNKYGLKPMIWSDMFFRMQYQGAYYIKTGSISDDVKNKVPKELTLIYWDYYTQDQQTVENMIRCHKQFDNPVAYAGGAWKWYGYSPFNDFSIKTSRMHLDQCDKYGVDQIIVTAWGDNGADCSPFAILPSLMLFAERSYSDVDSDERLRHRCEQCFGIDLKSFYTLDLPGTPPDKGEYEAKPIGISKTLLFNDPLLGILDKHIDPKAYASHYSSAAKELESAASKAGSLEYIFSNLASLCKLLAKKCDISIKIRNAYLAKDKKALADIADKTIPEIIDLLEKFIISMRHQWYKDNKTFGFDVQEIRLGGLKERLNSTILRLKAYCSGSIERIEELEQPVLYADCRSEDSNKSLNHSGVGSYSKAATTSVL